MKRFFSVIALALCITIGGVYATWTYTATNDIMDVNQTKTLQMAGATETGAAGAYEIDVSGLSLVIDDTNSDHYPELVVSGNVVVTFVPINAASGDIKNNGVISYTNLTTTVDLATWTFDDGHGNDGPIFTLNFTPHTIERADAASAEFKWSPAGNGTLTCTFPAEGIANHISLTQYYLDTKDLYNAYDSNLENGMLKFIVSDEPFS